MRNGAGRKLNKNNENKMRSKWFILTAFFSLTAAGIVFSILCFANSRVAFIERNYALCVTLSTLVFCGTCICSVWLALQEKDTAVKILTGAYFFALFCLVLIFLFQKTGFFQLVATSEGLQQYLERAGVWMPIFYIILQFLQVVVLPIPSIVSTVAGVALFGAFKTAVFSFIGIFLGSITAFFIGRKLGYKAVVWIVGSETLQKWQKKLKGKDNAVLTIMFLLPFFPDDILCFIAGLSTMSNRYFLAMVSLTRAVGILATCYSFDFIPWDTWWGLLLWGILLALIVFSFLFVYKNMDKIQNIYKKLRRTKRK